MGDEIYPIILPCDDTPLLMGTRTSGLFLYDGAAMRPFATDADPLIKSNLHRGFVLPKGALAFTTTNVGVVLVDLRNYISQEHDLKGYGFGLGVRVRKSTGRSGWMGSPGDYGWAGARGTCFWVDPKAPPDRVPQRGVRRAGVGQLDARVLPRRALVR